MGIGRRVSLLCERDRSFGADFSQQMKELGIQEVVGAPRAQERAVDRAGGTICRECLKHVFVFNEASRVGN
jgi:hypothetical protein